MSEKALYETRSALLNLSHELGREDRTFAVLGEGNVSARLTEVSFLVKASGSTLANLQENDLVQCNASMLLAQLDKSSLSDAEMETMLLACRTDSSSKKPSIEALFHSYLLTLPNIEFVSHTHPLGVNQIMCSPRAQVFAKRRIFPEQIVYCGLSSVLVPYTDPGLPLAQSIRRESESYLKKYRRAPQTILLKNHGLITLGPTAQAVWAAAVIAEKAATIFIGAAGLGGPTYMSQKNSLRIWQRPDEHYRRSLIDGTPYPRR